MDMDRYEALEKKASALQKENARLRAQIERLRAEARGRPLGQEEEEIIGLLAHASLDLTSHDVAVRLSMPPARAEHLLNKLLESGYVGASGHYMTGHSTYYVCPRGKEYAASRKKFPQRQVAEPAGNEISIAARRP
jgi:hypothetical protein